MAWIVLVVAGVFEVAWAIGLKYTDGFTRLWPSVGTAAAMIVSVVLLAWAMRTLPVGDPRHRAVRRSRDGRAAGVRGADRRGDRRAEARDRLTSVLPTRDARPRLSKRKGRRCLERESRLRFLDVASPERFPGGRVVDIVVA